MIHTLSVWLIKFYLLLDTEKERNKLMINAYPKITTFCQELGYEFQVVDMRWGIRDEATDDHMGTDICLREIQMCQRLSTGPNFVVSMILHINGRVQYYSKCLYNV